MKKGNILLDPINKSHAVLPGHPWWCCYYLLSAPIGLMRYSGFVVAVPAGLTPSVELMPLWLAPET